MPFIIFPIFLCHAIFKYLHSHNSCISNIYVLNINTFVHIFFIRIFVYVNIFLCIYMSEYIFLNISIEYMYMYVWIYFLYKFII